jgi:hypothetical protein
MDLQKFNSDPKKEVEGVWTALDETSRIKVARSGNLRYREAFRKAMLPYRQAMRAGILSEKIAEKVMTEVLADTVLLDWEGFTDGGKDLPYSKENAKAMLGAEHLKDFRELVITLSENAERFRQDDLKEDETVLKLSPAGQ